MAKVIFFHLFVILFTRGGSASVHSGICPLEQATPQDQTPLGPDPPGPDPPGPEPPQARHPPQTTPRPDPPGADIPPDQTPQSRPPETGSHRDQTPHPKGNRLQHTVYERPVRILLECILVRSFLLQHFTKKNVLGVLTEVILCCWLLTKNSMVFADW